MKHLLPWFEEVAEQKVNIEKSEFTFSPNLDKYMIAIFSILLEMPPVQKHSKYLGLPMLVGNRRLEVIRCLEDKMGKKVQDWKCKLLSWAEREVLIKSCLQAIPVYTMGCYKFPKSFRDNMSALAIKFWWSGDCSQKVVHCPTNQQAFQIEVFQEYKLPRLFPAAEKLLCMGEYCSHNENFQIWTRIS